VTFLVRVNPTWSNTTIFNKRLKTARFFYVIVGGLKYIAIYILDKWLFKTEPGL